MAHSAVEVTASGDFYVLSVFWPDERHRDMRGLLTRYGGDARPLAAAVFGPAGTPGSRFPELPGSLCVLPDGTVALSGGMNRTYLVDRDLTRLMGAWPGTTGTGLFGLQDMDWEKHYATAFAAAVQATPSDRLMCVLAEYGARNLGRYSTNLVGLADGPLTPGSRPDITLLASLDPEPSHQDDSHGIPYTVHNGAAGGFGNRPAPGLPELTRRRWPELDWSTHPRFGSPIVVADDRFLVPVFDRHDRRWSPFVFALLDSAGTLVGRLEGLDFNERSPYIGKKYTVVADPVRSRVFHQSSHGLHVWDTDGQPLTTLPTSEKPYKPLRRLGLWGCSPTGDLLLRHQEHNLLVRIPVPRDPAELGPAVESVLPTLTRERNHLKKTHTPIGWTWTNDLEPTRF
ncbi:hypothetical protein [Actinomadura napierensis]|uniref:hypothetical protein n=1 Tax=Actinomadura napierensis TaxID=267854 RepID=UPI0031DB0786